MTTEHRPENRNEGKDQHDPDGYDHGAEESAERRVQRGGLREAEAAKRVTEEDQGEGESLMIMERKKKPVDAVSVLRQMERTMGGAAKEERQEAQELVYDAWEAADADEEVDLFQRAVELDPTNVDAWLGLMHCADIGKEDSVAILRKLVATGASNLGKKAFETNKGHFWGLLETRPYMRARSELAWELKRMGRFDECIAEYEGMLELNPNDNQGVRYGLMACYLAVGALDGARRLFSQYDEREFSAVWAWAFVLERFLSGELKEAEKALREARDQNPHAQVYFLEHRRLPKSMPGSYSPGSPEEAMIAWDILRDAWKKHPEAQAWVGACKRRAPAPEREKNGSGKLH